MGHIDRIKQEKKKYVYLNRCKAFDKTQHMFMLETQHTRNRRELQFDKGHLQNLSMLNVVTLQIPWG